MARCAVIGSGPNGLAAAIALAEAGREVCVYEAATAPGGSVRTEELTLPGFGHDTFSAVHPAGIASPVFERMPLARHGLRWVAPEACYAHPLEGGRALMLYPSVERTAAAMDAVTGTSDGERWAEFAEPYVRAFDELRRAMLSGFPPVGESLRLAAALGPRRAAELTRLVLGSSGALSRRLFSSGEARAWLLGTAVHADVAPDGAGGAIAVAYLNMLGHGRGWPSPEGGAGALTDALVCYLRSLGGEVRCGAEVTRVECAGGRVRALEIAGEERVEVDGVIADVMPHALARLAGDAFPGLYRSMLKRYRYGPATVKVDWALDGPVPWEAPEVARAGTMHVAGGEEELIATLRASETTLPERPFMLMGQQSTADPSRAPAGRHTAWAYARTGAHGVDWSVEADLHARRMEAQVERFAPGFRDRILARHVMSPAALHARNPSLINGDVGGGTYRFPQVMLRPMPKLSPYRTPVEGLFLGSAATFPGGAVHGVSGDAAARALLARG